MIDFVNLYFIPALTLGSIYALGAVGISMIFGILRFAHFAHGDSMMLAAYFEPVAALAQTPQPAPPPLVPSVMSPNFVTQYQP